MIATIPGRHDEAWRWADLSRARAMLETIPPANDEIPDAAAHWLDLPGSRRLFVGGRAIGDPAETPEPDSEAPAHPLANLAATAATEGARIALADGVDGGTVQIVHIGTGGASHGVTRLILGAGTRLVLIETLADVDEALGGHDHWLNHRLDATLGDGAELVRVVRLKTAAGLASERAHVRLGPGARFTGLAIATAGGATRTETHVTFGGTGAHADVNGILLGDGAAALDALTRLVHAVPDTSSGQVWRLVGAGRAQVSVAGGVSVARHAQRTDAEQSLKALVLKRTAAANLKPELEIYADDVKCAHGCTVGELDPAALFYLAARGVPPAEARAILTRAFVADALTSLGDGPLAAALDVETRAWLDARG